jgi:hypothetical protein
MDQETRRIEDEIRTERSELDRNIGKLGTQARALADWRTHYRRHSGAALALAFGGGLLIGLKARSQSPAAPPRAAHEEPRRRGGFNPLAMLPENSRAKTQVSDAWEHILEALIGVSALKAVEWIGSIVPGFRDEYQARQTAEPSPAGTRDDRPATSYGSRSGT